MTIAKMYGNLFSGRPSKILPWSWLKSLGLGLGTRSLGLSLGLEVQSLGLGLGLDKKSYLHHCRKITYLESTNPYTDCYQMLHIVCSSPM